MNKLLILLAGVLLVYLGVTGKYKQFFAALQGAQTDPAAGGGAGYNPFGILSGQSSTSLK